jgi:ribosomal protein L12E/L44/L45/RPP1/RPP2
MAFAFKRHKTGEVRKDTNTGKDVIVWAIELDGQVVGEALSIYKTATQYTWDVNVTVDGVKVEILGAKSMAKSYKQIEEQLKAANSAAKPAPKARAPKATPAAAPVVETDEVTA